MLSQEVHWRSQPDEQGNGYLTPVMVVTSGSEDPVLPELLKKFRV